MNKPKAARKPAARKPTPRKPAARKPTPRKPAPRKPAPRKPAALTSEPAPPLDPTTDAALLALPKAYGDPPDIPVDVARREIASLARLCMVCAVDLAKVGIDAATIELAARFAKVLGRKEKAWQRARGAVALRASDRTLLAEAEALDAALVAGGRWALRGDARAQAELSRIAEGSGLHDTLQDLRELLEFWERHEEHLGKTLITAKDLARAATLVERLEPAAQKEAADVAAARAQELRNRAFWAAHALAQDLRDGGRYAYSSNPKIAAKFTSRYRTAAVRRTRTKAERAKRSAAAATPSETPAPE